MPLPRVARRAKQLFSRHSISDKGVAAVVLGELDANCNLKKGLNGAPSKPTDGWTIKALLNSPRRAAGAATAQVLRPLAAAVRPLRWRQQPAPAAIPEDFKLASGSQSTALEGLDGLLDACSNDPLLLVESLNAMLAADDLQNLRSHSWQLQQLLHTHGGPSRQQSHSDSLEAKLAAVVAELVAVRHKAQQQAMLLAECHVCSADMRRQLQEAQARLMHCQEETAMVEQREAEVREVALQEDREMEQQINALHWMLLDLHTSTTSQQTQLRHATEVAQRRAAQTEAAAWQRVEAGAEWKCRFERMAETHMPLTFEEEQQRAQWMLKYKNRVC